MTDDLISRQAAIATAISGRVRTLPTTEDGEDWIRVNEVRESLLNLPTASPRWIPVTERVPEDKRNVLVTVYFHGVRDYSYGENTHLTPSYYVEIAQRYDDEWHSDSDEYKIAKDRHEVIAWLPLPEPWKGENDGK